MMLRLSKIGFWSPFFYICVLSSIKGSKAVADCANVTNLTRISATSVVVTWEYRLTSLRPGPNFEIRISEFGENGSVIQQSPIVGSSSDDGRYSNLIDTSTLIANTQQLCFVISVVTGMPTSSGEMTASEDTCPKECLPSMPQVPAAPEGFAYANTTTGSEVRFSWNTTDSSVILACNNSGDVVPSIIIQFCGSCSPVSVGSFLVSTPYTCSLSQKDGVTVGPSSVISFTTDVERPPPPNFSIEMVGITSITIQFSSISSTVYYQLSVRLQSNGQIVVERHIYNGLSSRNWMEIRDLYPFTNYQVELQIRNSESMNLSYPFIHSVKTREEAPGKISRNSLSVHMTSNTPSTILVAWEPPDITNGSIISYNYCWSAGGTTACAMTTTNSTIINLSSHGNMYAVKVAANTSGGTGPYSDDVYVYIPGEQAPNAVHSVNLNSRANYIQLKFRGINNCSLWMRFALQNDITYDLLTQLSNLCNCNLFQSIRSFSPRCNDVVNQNTVEILFQAEINPSSQCSRISNCEVLDTLEQWIRRPSPNVKVGHLSYHLLLDRSCPLYTTSIMSNECLDNQRPTTSSNGGAVAGALIGGILLGAALAVGIGLGILLLLWHRQRRGKQVKMMKKVDPINTDTVAMRNIPRNQTLMQNNDDYEPISVYVQDSSKDHATGNAYDSQTDGQGPAKGKKQKKSSKKDSGKHVIEDESGYVVPDVLWEGKQRPVAPGSAKLAQTPSGKTSEYETIAPETTTKVEYDVPGGVEHQDTNKFKGQREPQSQQLSTGTLGHKEQRVQSGKDHQKQPLQVQQPSKITSQPKQSQNNEPKISTVQGGKPTKKNKPPNLHKKKENPSELALQYQSDTSASSFGTSGASAATSAVPHAHDSVKSKLQNLFSPASSSSQQPTAKATHAKALKQPGSSATENTKIQHQQKQQEPKVSKVMAMAQKLQGGGQPSPSETSDSKSVGIKKPLLPKPAGSSTTTPAAVQYQQKPSGASMDTSMHMPPTKKPKPTGKGTANISLKSNKAYDKWSREEDGVVPTQKPSARGGGRGNENLYHF